MAGERMLKPLLKRQRIAITIPHPTRHSDSRQYANTLSGKSESRNVGGDGAEAAIPTLRIAGRWWRYSAHWDHLGIGPSRFTAATPFQMRCRQRHRLRPFLIELAQCVEFRWSTSRAARLWLIAVTEEEAGLRWIRILCSASCFPAG